MNSISYLTGIFLLLCTACSSTRFAGQDVDDKDVTRIISALAHDSLRGRAVFTKEIDQAADFISTEFKRAGLQPFSSASDFLQSFEVMRVVPSEGSLTINGDSIASADFFAVTDQPGINWNDNPEIGLKNIDAADDFNVKLRNALVGNQNALVRIDPVHKTSFERWQKRYSGSRIVSDNSAMTHSVVCVISPEPIQSFRISLSNSVSQEKLHNVVGVIPGKGQKSDEYVVFSAHYDHLGIIDAIGQDSIANGADDDASGTTAVMALAKYYGAKAHEGRTLIFVAFTAEESGGFGSQYFSRQLDPDRVAAMVNIEMIGKDSKFGKNTAFITGYEKSDFGKLMQKRLESTPFRFHPDPYPEQNLFYRSDNATLAALGVPAHTISTDQIDKDPYYHTVKDELKTLDIRNITATIQAIAIGAEGFVKGTDTPARIPKLNP